jgi:hypothetical protein
VNAIPTRAGRRTFAEREHDRGTRRARIALSAIDAPAAPPAADDSSADPPSADRDTVPAIAPDMLLASRASFSSLATFTPAMRAGERQRSTVSRRHPQLPSS